MLKKINPIIFIFAPTLFGYLNSLLYPIIQKVPVINYLYFFVYQALLIFLWFWVGGRFAKYNFKTVQAVLIGNSIGIFSLILYMWQFILLSDEQRNLTIAAFSQFFSTAVYFISALIAMLFEPDRSNPGVITLRGMQIIGLVFMMLIFLLGFFSKRRKLINELQKIKEV